MIMMGEKHTARARGRQEASLSHLKTRKSIRLDGNDDVSEETNHLLVQTTPTKFYRTRVFAPPKIKTYILTYLLILFACLFIGLSSRYLPLGFEGIQAFF